MTMDRIAVAAILLLTAAGPARAQSRSQQPPYASQPPQILFSDIADWAGIGDYAWQNPYGIAAGFALSDYDDDGLVDLFVPTFIDRPNQLYRNLGTGQFEEIAADVGLAATHNRRAALWLDYDGDGDLDLLTAGDCFSLTCTDGEPLTLYRQVNPQHFEDVTVEAGLAGLSSILHDQIMIGGLSAGDIDNDGFPEIAVSFYEHQLRLYRNLADGTFLDITTQAGLGAGHRRPWQTLFHDFDGDGWQDLLVCIDWNPNHLYMNQQDGTFIDRAAEFGLASAWNEMGIAFGDYDNDGDFDIFMTNISDFFGRDSVFFRNDSVGSDLQYTEIAAELGVQNMGWGWGTVFADFDRDGWLDLAATNGFYAPPWSQDTSRLFSNTGGPAPGFLNVSDEVGFNDTYWGSGLAAIDYDLDGDLDLVQSCLANGPFRLLENDTLVSGTGYSWLIVRPRMNGPNSQALGTTVRVKAGGMTQIRYLTAGGGFMGQVPSEAYFGLRNAQSVPSVRIQWPDRSVTEMNNVQVNQVIEVTAPF